MWSEICFIKIDISEEAHSISELDIKINLAILAKAGKMSKRENLNIGFDMLLEKYMDRGQ